MQAWFYYRGKLIVVPGEHPGVIAAVAKGKVRMRFHEECETLAVQGRSRDLCRRAVAKYLDEGCPMPSRINAQWPGRYVECFIQEWG